MTSTLAVDATLALLVLGLAVWVTVARAAYGAVAGYVAYGLLVDDRLGTTGGGGRRHDRSRPRNRSHRYPVARCGGAPGTVRSGGAGPPTRRCCGCLIGLLCAAVAAALAAVVLTLPEPAPTLAPLVAENLPPTGMLNPVTGVLLAHRAIDTLLESVVLVLALIGVWSVAADSAWGGQPGFLPRPRSGSRADLAGSAPAALRDPVSASISSGTGRTIRAASSRAPRCWPPCGC